LQETLVQDRLSQLSLELSHMESEPSAGSSKYLFNPFEQVAAALDLSSSTPSSDAMLTASTQDIEQRPQGNPNIYLLI
jgi:hypothetical protein